MYKYITVLFLSLALYSCENSQNENLENLERKFAREVTLTTHTVGDTVYHLTKQTLWNNGEIIAAKTDTIITPNKIKTWIDSASKEMNMIPIYVTVQ